MLTSDELTAMRTTHALTFDQSCSIRRRTSSNSSGGTTDSFSETATCMVMIREEGSPHEVTTDGAMRSHVFFIVWAPHGTDIRPSDKLVIGGHTYEVTGIDAGKGYSLNLRARCVRVEGL